MAPGFKIILTYFVIRVFDTCYILLINSDRKGIYHYKGMSDCGFMALLVILQLYHDKRNGHHTLKPCGESNRGFSVTSERLNRLATSTALIAKDNCRLNKDLDDVNTTLRINETLFLLTWANP